MTTFRRPAHALAALLVALAACAGPFEWRADVDLNGVTPGALPAGAPVVAASQPPRMLNFNLLAQEPFAPMTQSDANRLQRVILEHATAASLQKRTSASLRATMLDTGYPRLLVAISQAELQPSRDGVAFVIRASAHGAASADKESRPSTHTVRTPGRKAEEWLASDAELLRSDLEKVMELLSASIASAYRPAQ